jgi:hypothetical protein
MLNILLDIFTHTWHVIMVPSSFENMIYGACDNAFSLRTWYFLVSSSRVLETYGPFSYCQSRVVIRKS